MKPSRIIALAALFVLVGFLPAAAQKIVLSGYVREDGSGEPLNGAVVFTADLKTGVSTNSAGFYSMELANKEQLVKCSYAGYLTAEFTITPKGKNIRHDFVLEEDREVLEAAKVFSKSKREQLTLPQLGKETVSADIKRCLLLWARPT